MSQIWAIWLCFVFVKGTAMVKEDLAARQILDYVAKTSGPPSVMMTSAGMLIEETDASLTLNRKLIHNEYFMDSLTHIVRERIPERVVHAKAAGAFGYFQVTHDISHICKAKFLSPVGKKTPVAVRLSPVLVEKGGIDTARQPRGFAIKFYTEEGNFDIAGFNTPMYAYKDPVLFTTFVRAQKRNPSTHLFDSNTMWDYLTLRPESLHMFFIVFGDRGIPDGYRHMPGFALHTYQVENEQGEKYFIRFHILPDAGIKNLRSHEAMRIAGEDPDYGIRDLYNAIARSEFPTWTIYLQILTLEDVKKAKFDVFDVTRVLPQDDYPLQPLGRLVLNRNPVNYFAEVEQLAFNPANLVPGILGAPDKLFEGRRIPYRDAQHYRLGANFNKIPVNSPLHHAMAYNRDGRPPVNDNGGDSPNYYPNSFNGPVSYRDKNRNELLNIIEGDAVNFDQARELYENEMTTDERRRLVENLLFSLGGVGKNLQDRAVKLFTLIHPDLGSKLAQGLSVNRTLDFYDSPH